MADKLHIYDLTPFDGRLREFRKAMQLFAVYYQMKDSNNRITVSKTDLAEALDVSYRTVTSWIFVLAKNGLIKYRYSGATVLNPRFCFDGTKAQYIAAIRTWKDFQSDISPFKEDYIAI